jgi:Fur family ferric uptake transcriptional regulator
MSTLPCGRKKPSNTHKNTSKNADWKLILNRYLKEKKLRSTVQKVKVAELIFSKKSHFEVQTLVKEAQQSYPEIGPATIYRTVKTLCDAGLLHESFQSHSGVTLYEAQEDEHHDHVVCMDCGEIFEFHDESMEEAQTRAIKKIDFQVVKHKHVIYAKCALLDRS